MKLSLRMNLAAMFLLVFAGSVSAQHESLSEHSTLVEEQVKSVRERLASGQNRLEKIQAQIDMSIDQLNNGSVSDIAYEEVFRRLHVHKVELTIELKGLTARMELLKEKAVQSSEAKDDLVKVQRDAMNQMLHSQLQRLKQVETLQKKGIVSQLEVQEAKQLVIEAEIKMKEFETETKQASPAVVEAVFETSLAIAERKAKLEAVQEMLAKHVESRSRIEKLGQLMSERESESRRLKMMVSDLNKLEVEKNALRMVALDRLMALKVKLEELKAKYGPGHPNVVAVEQQLNALGVEDLDEDAEEK